MKHKRNRMVSVGGVDVRPAAGGPGPVERAPVQPDSAAGGRRSGDAADQHAVRPVDAARDALDPRGPTQDRHGDQAKAELQAKLDAILAKGERRPPRPAPTWTRKLAATTRKVDDNAVKEGEAKTAERLGAEFAPSTEAISNQKQQLGASWGELMILHTIAANTSGDLTPEQIFEMRRAEKG